MTTTDTTATSLDLTEQVTIADRKHGTRTVPGYTVAPGLIVTAAYRANREPVPRRYQLTHAPTGLTLALGAQCATHVLQAATHLAAVGIDWTQDRDALLADKDRLIEATTTFRLTCDNPHTGCPGDPDPWQIRCRTCDWEYDPEDDDAPVPTTAKEARRIADDHECDPWIEIKPPDADNWGPPWSFVDKPEPAAASVEAVA